MALVIEVFCPVLMIGGDLFCLPWLICNNALKAHLIFGWDVMNHLGHSLLELFPVVVAVHHRGLYYMCLEMSP